MMELYKINEIYSHKYYKIPKELFIIPKYKDSLNSDARILYSILLDRMELSRENNWINEKGEIYLIYKREVLADMMGVCSKTVGKAFKLLTECQLIKEQRQGLGLPNLIYVGKIEREGEGVL